jgi:hypothetical protein
MSYSYINPSQGILEMALETLGGFAAAPAHLTLPEIPTIECELEPEWNEFEVKLGEFKRKFYKAKRDLGIKTNELGDLQKSSTIAKLIVDNVPSEDLKTRVASVIDNYESEVGIATLTQQCGKFKGQVQAMKKVLQDTEAERYERFTCFICQERLIDLFIDPCGHVVCAQCWTQTRDKYKCPGCRAAINNVKKIFTI